MARHSPPLQKIAETTEFSPALFPDGTTGVHPRMLRPSPFSPLLTAMFLTAATAISAQIHPPGPLPRLLEALRCHPDLSYAANGNSRQQLDLYLPRSPAGHGPLPLLLFFHGGAFLGGDRKPEPEPGDPCGLRLLLSLAAGGDYAAASVGYRLSPEACWPAQIHDAKAAVRWLRGQAAIYRLDPDRIGVMGTSAGGHLAAILGTSGGEASLEGRLGSHLEAGSQVACVVDQYGPTDFLALHGADNHSPNTPAAKLIGGPLPQHPEATRGASPLAYVRPGNPPFLILHGTADPVVPFRQSELLHEALLQAGVDATLVPVHGGGHGGFSSPDLPLRITAFFDHHLRGKRVTARP